MQERRIEMEQVVNEWTAGNRQHKKKQLFVLLAVGVLELLSMVGVVQAAKGSGRKAGDFSWDPLYFTQGAKADFFFEAEIQHARLAMLAFSGLVTQSALLEKGFPYF